MTFTDDDGIVVADMAVMKADSIKWSFAFCVAQMAAVAALFLR